MTREYECQFSFNMFYVIIQVQKCVVHIVQRLKQLLVVPLSKVTKYKREKNNIFVSGGTRLKN